MKAAGKWGNNIKIDEWCELSKYQQDKLIFSSMEYICTGHYESFVPLLSAQFEKEYEKLKIKYQGNK